MLAPFLGNIQEFSNVGALESISFQPTAAPLIGDRADKPLYTGRFFVIFPGKNINYGKLADTFTNAIGSKVASSSDFKTQAVNEDQMDDANVFLYEDLGIALVSVSESTEISQLRSKIDNNVIVEPELVVYLPPFLIAEQESIVAQLSTWGIDIIKANNSNYTGLNVPVAILDTGLDLTHPDFAGRNIISQSFVPGIISAQDILGHGTHCTGTACGHTDNTGIRYGVAHNSNIYIGKVLDNTGRGAQSWIINGIDWASKVGCKVISMSLGSAVFPGLGFSTAYETTAANAVSKGAVVVAAAGNDSRRSFGVFNPVSSPANCPSIVAVAAVGKKNPAEASTIANLEVANFSNRAINPNQDVDIAAPGVSIYSSWPLPQRYNTISGTSMATPHVAGILALLWEQYPSHTPAQIIQEMINLAQALPFPKMDIGAGLVDP